MPSSTESEEIINSPMAKIDNIATLNDATTLTTLAADVINKIDEDKKILRVKQKEIDEITNALKADVLQVTESDNTEGLPNYRDRNKKSQSASEKMEKIKAFVELTKASVDISKSLIGISERQHKILIDAYKIYKNNVPAGEIEGETMTPASIAKLVKEAKNKKGNDL